MKVANLRHRAANDFTVGLRDEVDDSVGGWMLRTEIDDDLFFRRRGSAQDVAVELHVDGHG